MDSQGNDVWVKLFYVELTGLFGTISKVIGRFGLTRRNQVEFFRCNLVYLSIVKVLTDATWPHHFYVAS